MSRLGRRNYRRTGVVLLALWCGACAGSHGYQEPSQHPYSYHNGPTEVDPEPVRSTGSSRYRQPRIVNRYQYDKTEVDLATPQPSSPETAIPTP